MKKLASLLTINGLVPTYGHFIQNYFKQEDNLTLSEKMNGFSGVSLIIRSIWFRILSGCSL